MPDITLERGHTAVLIADFYAEMMNTLPHATERGVVPMQDMGLPGVC